MLKSIVSISLIAAVSAHQNLHQFWVNDKTPGRGVGIRMPPSNSPVTDLKSNDIVCNVNGAKVPSGVQTIAANAGDTIKVQWDQSTHPGPITHMLYGPVDDASLATGIGAGWFKIDEQNFVDGKWANEIMSANDMTRSFKLPKTLRSGEYLLRSEMLALHASQTKDGAQFYIGCIQLKITSTVGGDCSPKITLPGAYSADDANIYIPNFYFGFDPTTYKAPGGAVATCVAGAEPGPIPPTTTPAVSSKPTTTLLTSTSKAATSTDAQPPKPTGTPVQLYGQCGGTGYTGSTVCVSGAKCVKSNDFYSQCVPA